VVQESILIVSAYLLGSIPSGLLLAKALGTDIRNTGSGNIGATNVYRTLGRTAGVLTLVADCLKGLIPVLIAQKLGFGDLAIAVVGMAAFVGHIYTIFLGFKGGKGVATALGVFLAISPLSVLIAFFLFLGVVLTWRYISLGSVVAAAAIPLIIAILQGNGYFIFMSTLIAALVIYKHRSNIERLRAGTEIKFRA
jgi:glycerol-3-phosphate acyltransferase PlsY